MSESRTFTGQIMKGGFLSRVTFPMTMGGSHSMIPWSTTCLGRTDPSSSVVIRRGGLSFFLRELSAIVRQLSEKRASPMRLKLTYTKIISIECSLTNTESRKHIFSRFCDSFQGFHGRRESDPRVKLPVRMRIGINSPTVRGDSLNLGVLPFPRGSG